MKTKRVFLIIVSLSLLFLYIAVSTVIYLRSSEKDRTIYNDAMTAIKDGNYDLALDYMNEAVKGNPDDPIAYIWRGNVYLELRNYSNAIEDYTFAIRLNPNSDEAYYNRARAYQEMNNYTLAIKDLDKVLELNDEYVNALYTRGRLYYILHDYEKALTDANKLISISPEFIFGYNLLGFIYYETNNSEQALLNFKLYLDQSEGQPIDTRIFSIIQELENKELPG